MGYSSSVISAASQIAALLTTFATGLGFTVDSSTPATPIIVIPGDEDDSNSTDINVKWVLSNATISSVSTQIYDLQFNSLAANTARSRGPIINAVALAPTKVEFIGQLSPTPYIAIVISFGTNLYRHLYLGRVEKRGHYGGGEVISAQYGPSAVGAGDMFYGDTGSSGVKYLFGGRSSSPLAAGLNGFMRIKHASAVSEYNEFLAAQEVLTTSAGNGKIIGGFLDSINDGYMARGRAPFANRTLLTPTNLYQLTTSGGVLSLIPLGRPAGFRMVNLTDILTPATLTVGADTWHVYPASVRDPTGTAPAGTSNWRSRETSYYVGYAYKE